MGGTGPVRPAKSRLGDHAKGGKASTAVVSIPLRGYTAKSKDVFFQFSRPSPSEEILPPPRGGGGKSAMREGKGYRGLYLLSNFTRSRTRFFSADPFNRERVENCISLHSHTPFRERFLSKNCQLWTIDRENGAWKGGSLKRWAVRDAGEN